MQHAGGQRDAERGKQRGLHVARDRALIGIAAHDVDAQQVALRVGQDARIAHALQRPDE